MENRGNRSIGLILLACCLGAGVALDITNHLDVGWIVILVVLGIIGLELILPG